MGNSFILLHCMEMAQSFQGRSPLAPWPNQIADSCKFTPLVKCVTSRHYVHRINSRSKNQRTLVNDGKIFHTLQGVETAQSFQGRWRWTLALGSHQGDVGVNPSVKCVRTSHHIDWTTPWTATNESTHNTWAWELCESHTGTSLLWHGHYQFI